MLNFVVYLKLRLIIQPIFLILIKKIYQITQIPSIFLAGTVPPDQQSL